MIGHLTRIEDKIDNLTWVITEMRKEIKVIKEEMKDLKEIEESQKSHMIPTIPTVSIF
jgi:TRAP-type uncharacterized transport system substrate-binding protein